MLYQTNTGRIPGTILTREESGNLTGAAFLDSLFYLQDGIALSGIRRICGIDGSTLQNWIKRGWAGKAVRKKYSRNQFARILLINLMRDSLYLDTIDAILHSLNGDLETEEDDLLPESEVYDLVCRLLDRGDGKPLSKESLRSLIRSETASIPEPFPDARARLCAVLEIIVLSSLSRELLSEIGQSVSDLLP
ncbi:MAG: DUF1836 domain-containing protein [Clostridia bacterium]|nr:DUF1836 domain-containing protein [Clostridia bacterium]MBO4798948.1 DUF1836 domain-containing protein [Candidatus Methanomethylophilaceae archaeon]MBQ4290796.1 DUF1836 domain-containing protein [Clostridia bacterium]